MFKTIITAQELYHHLVSNKLVIVDCRFSLKDKEWGRRAYKKQHIPNALYAHLDEDLSGEIIPSQTGRHPLPAIEKATQLFSKWGIDAQTQVVTYDNLGGAIAARLWWLLRWLGHDKVAVLNGGIQAWEELDYPLADSISVAAPKVFVPNPRNEWVVGADFVLQQLDNPEYLIVDSRAAERYRGEVEPIDPVAGHIPNAVNLPFGGNKDGEGRFLTKEELATRFVEVLGTTKSENALFYCGSGVTACYNLLAMSHAGVGIGRLYSGSWSDWITDKTRPIV